MCSLRSSRLNEVHKISFILDNYITFYKNCFDINNLKEKTNLTISTNRPSKMIYCWKTQITYLQWQWMLHKIIALCPFWLFLLNLWYWYIHIPRYFSFQFHVTLNMNFWICKLQINHHKLKTLVKKYFVARNETIF